MYRTEVPSGEKRGKSSDPIVIATSPPPLSCLSQMRDCPSRSEVKARVLPSGLTAGDVSWPLYVTSRIATAEVCSGLLRRVQSRPRESKRMMKPNALVIREGRSLLRDAPRVESPSPDSPRADSRAKARSLAD